MALFIFLERDVRNECDYKMWVKVVGNKLDGEWKVIKPSFFYAQNKKRKVLQHTHVYTSFISFILFFYLFIYLCSVFVYLFLRFFFNPLLFSNLLRVFLNEHGSIRRDILLDPRVSANTHIITNSDRAKHLSSRSHHHIIPEGRVSLIILLHEPCDLISLEVERSDRDALVQPAPAPDDRGLPDDRPCGVVDEEEVPDLRPRVDVHPRVHVRELRQLAGVDFRPGFVENVGDTLDHDGPKARVAADDLGIRGARGVADKGGVDIFFELLTNLV